ncbi:MAG: hypothetical protein QF926_02515 [Alphaproteobacteria bacterium]|nr:hypothetical protein [Alphaproteobacteria bacterium]MDP6515484.1 hypothetical protein [Alphaproteobacteria bacterium]
MEANISGWAGRRKAADRGAALSSALVSAEHDRATRTLNTSEENDRAIVETNPVSSVRVTEQTQALVDETALLEATFEIILEGFAFYIGMTDSCS